MSRRTTVLACLVLTTLLGVITATPAAAAAPTDWDYVALGDSYSSGVGAPGQSGLCLRSPHGYPGRWNAANDPRTYRSVACGGATTDSLRDSQLWPLTNSTDLVTLTIGGNDIGFASTMISCTLSSDTACAATVATAVEEARTELPPKLDATYNDIRAEAPNATIVVLGYPILFDTRSTTCGIAGMSIPKRRAINAGAVELNAVIEARTEAAGLTWSDVTDEFAGHGICAPTPWINGLTAIPPTNSFHPNAAGYRSGYLPALNSALP